MNLDLRKAGKAGNWLEVDERRHEVLNHFIVAKNEKGPQIPAIY
ncbi:MAG TPA: hypothetical protein PK951_00375 [Chitinophagaceae bacterium]|nr:hypothetical protein [Chitinophagaceae bacterium]